MANTVRTQSDLLALWPDNILGLISEQTGRDFIVSIFGWTGSGPPTADNDNVDSAGIGARFDIGSRWNDFLNGDAWFCVDGSAHAAVWTKACCNTFPKGIIVPLNDPTRLGLDVRGALGQTAELEYFRDNAANPLRRMLPTGGVIQQSNDDVHLIHKLISALTTKDFYQAQDHLGAVLASISYQGEITAKGFCPGIKTVNNNYTATRADSLILVDSSVNTPTISLLPAASMPPGRVVMVKRINASGHTITISGTGGDLIDNAASQTITQAYVGLAFAADPTAGVWRGVTYFRPFGQTFGTVTSVGLALPASIFTVSGSPVTTTGTLTATLATQAAKTVLAGPASGAAAAPTFRVLGAGDMPTITQVTTALALDYTTIAAAGPGGSVLIPLISPLGAGYVPVAVGLWFTGGALFTGPGITGVFFRFYVGANGPLSNWNVNFAALTSGAVFSALGGASNLLDAGDAFSVQVATTGAGVEALNAGHCTVFLVSSKVS